MGYLINLAIIHAKTCGAIFLGNQNNLVGPAALAWLYGTTIQHLLDFGLFDILFSDGKSPWWQAYWAVFPSVSRMCHQVSSHNIGWIIGQLDNRESTGSISWAYFKEVTGYTSLIRAPSYRVRGASDKFITGN